MSESERPHRPKGCRCSGCRYCITDTGRCCCEPSSTTPIDERNATPRSGT